MNESNLNAELLSSESRGKKHIPLAVFAVIVIHVVLFLVLLIAAGCRAKARAKQNATTEVASQETVATNAVASLTVSNTISQGRTEPVIASEPEIERERVSAPGPERTVQRASPSRPRADVAPVSAVPTVRTYIVKPGDTVGRIAKEHGVSIQMLRNENRLKNDLIRPGQKLRISKQTQMASI
jgi:LysM repeat protein